MLLELSMLAQHEVERDLADYEQYVANRDRVLKLASTTQTGAREMAGHYSMYGLSVLES